MIVKRYPEAGKVADIASARLVLSVYNKRESEGYTRGAWALEYPFNIQQAFACLPTIREEAVQKLDKLTILGCKLRTLRLSF